MKNSVSSWEARRPNDFTTLTDSVCDIKQLCFYLTLVLGDRLVLLNARLRQAQNRCSDIREAESRFAHKHPNIVARNYPNLESLTN